MNEQAKTAKEVREENEALQKEIADLKAKIAADKVAGRDTSPEPVLLFDPYDTDINPLRIKKHPEGKHLSWKNPTFRDQKGWKGWVPVEWDDEIGQHITDYVNDPPSQMEGTSKQDNYVRRDTDCILCWIDERIWNTRQLKRTMKAARMQQRANAAANQQIQEGVSTFGKGVERTKSSRSSVSKDTFNPEDPSHRTEGFLDEE